MMNLVLLYFVALKLFNPQDPNIVMGAMLQKLNEIKQVRYAYQREVKYFSSGIEDKLSGNMFIQFDPEAKILGLKYQWEDDQWEYIYNGTEKFDLDKKNKTMEVYHTIMPEQFNYTSIFYNSFFTLKNILPLIIKDNTIPKAVSDTTIGKVPLFVLRFSIKNRVIGHLGDFRPLTTNRVINYSILIDKASYLPTEVLQTNSVNKDFIKTSFTKINTNADTPAENSWYYSTYLQAFKQPVQTTPEPLISKGEVSPNWSLPQFGNNKDVSLDKLKGKVVLLEFWIKNCGYCQSAFPELAQIYARFKNRPFELMAINCYDTEKSVQIAYQKNNPMYAILYNGLAVAHDYGINAYPTAILIDKNGAVVYAGVFDAVELMDKISKLL